MTDQIKMKPVKRRRRAASLDKKKAMGGWIFVLPFVIGFLLIYLPIIADSIYFSFCQMEVLGGGAKPVFEFVGFQNYSEALLEDNEYVQVLIKGLQNMIFDIPMILMFSLFMAVLLNQKMAGRAIFRAIFFIPVILATGIMETVESMNIMDDYMGDVSGIEDGSGQSASGDIVNSMDIEQLFAGMAVGQELVTYVTTAINNIYNIVNRSGVQMLIFLSGLQSISPAIYESVQIDGASAWETFWKITFPMISPMILVNAIYTVIDAFTTESSVMTYINLASQQLPEQGMAISTAMSWIYFLVVILILALIAGICSAYVFYQKKN